MDTIPNVVKALLSKTNYDKNEPPLKKDVNPVMYTMELDAISTIDDYNSQVTVIVMEIFKWQDKRLAYQTMNLAELSSYHKSYWIDLYQSRDLIWKPSITYTSIVDISIESEQFYLFPNGNIDWVRKISLTLQCPFNYALFPNDYQECLIVPFCSRYSKALLNLTQNQVDLPLLVVPTYDVVTTTSSPSGYLSFLIDMEYVEPMDIYNDLDGSLNSGLSYKLKLKRQPYFFMVYYIVPSVIFVVISYCSFWINSNSVTARCSLAITTVLITINFSNTINNLIPPINYDAWLSSYYTVVLIFNCVAMIEFVFVNYCQYNYQTRQLKINESMSLIRANLSKYKKKLLKKIDGYKSQAFQFQEQEKKGGLRMSNNNINQPSIVENLQTEAGLLSQREPNTKTLMNLFTDKDKPITIASKVSVLSPSSKNNNMKMNESDLIDEEFKIEEEKMNDQQEYLHKQTNHSLKNSLNQSKGDNFFTSEHKLSQEFFSGSSQEVDEFDIQENESEKSPEKQRQEGADLQELQFRDYHFKLAHHIDEMEKAQKGNNPAKNIMVFNEFKVFVVKHWHLIDCDLDSKTRIEIESAFSTENSKTFLLNKFFAENIDYIFRFLYIAVYILYFCLRLSVLYDFVWLPPIAITVFCASFIVWIMGMFYYKMKQEQWSFKITWGYFSKLECIFPRRKQELKYKEEPVKSDKKMAKRDSKVYN